MDSPKLPRHEPDDDPETDAERRNTNIFLAVAGILIVAGGIWLFDAIADSRKAQLCLESGRRNCNPIAVSPRKLD